MIPVILFSYDRPNHLRRTLDCLRENQVPLIYSFSDGPRTAEIASEVEKVRDILRTIDWCDVVLNARTENLGLGKSILAGVSQVLNKHEMCIVFEDDLICVPGTYSYLGAALEHYRNDSRVMSVTGWTHPKVTPHDINKQPYFDGRAECWVWGTWARAWQGMENNAIKLIRRCIAQGIDIYRYGADLPVMAKTARQNNTWAVSFLYWHILNHGLCLRPPWSMVNHIGFDPRGTNVKGVNWMEHIELKHCPDIPETWNSPIEHSECPALWQRAFGTRPAWHSQPYLFCRFLASSAMRLLSHFLKACTARRS